MQLGRLPREHSPKRTMLPVDSCTIPVVGGIAWIFTLWPELDCLRLTQSARMT